MNAYSSAVSLRLSNRPDRPPRKRGHSGAYNQAKLMLGRWIRAFLSQSMVPLFLAGPRR